MIKLLSFTVVLKLKRMCKSTLLWDQLHKSLPPLLRFCKAIPKHINTCRHTNTSSACALATCHSPAYSWAPEFAIVAIETPTKETTDIILCVFPSSHYWWSQYELVCLSNTLTEVKCFCLFSVFIPWKKPITCPAHLLLQFWLLFFWDCFAKIRE